MSNFNFIIILCEGHQPVVEAFTEMFDCHYGCWFLCHFLQKNHCIYQGYLATWSIWCGVHPIFWLLIFRDYDEIILVFDTYRDDSLKSATRDKRRQGRAPIQYQVRDDTNIKHIPMSRFLSHDKTKADLTNYLAAKTQKNWSSPLLQGIPGATKTWCSRTTITKKQTHC